jgi:hypothetical protein
LSPKVRLMIATLVVVAGALYLLVARSGTSDSMQLETITPVTEGPAVIAAIDD